MKRLPIRIMLGVMSVALSLQGCASYPKVAAGVPLELHRGQWVDYARFSQRGFQVDRSDAKEALERVDASSASAKTANGLEVAALATSIVAGALIGVGSVQAANRQDAWPYFLGGGAAVLGASITLGLSSDAKFDAAVNAYNRQLGPSPAPR